MASFDDLAFAPPLSATTSVASSSASVAALYCKDCDEVATQTTPDRKRCLICGCELENRSSAATTTQGGRIPVDPSQLSESDFERLLQQLLETLGGELGVSNESRRPAAESAVSNLGSFVADQASTIEVAIAVSGIKGEVVAVPANFGPCESLPRAGVCLAQPLDGARELQNADEVKGKIVVMERGTCTFAQKVLRAQACGAIAVIIIQTFDVWPYTMTDSKGESAKITIPAFMLSMKQGTRFLEYLREHSHGPAESDPSAEITVRKDARECVICQVDMSIGMKLTRMPCQHMFHTDCLHQWLKIGNSCPICRVEIPSKNGSSAASSAQDQRSPAWGEWFSHWPATGEREEPFSDQRIALAFVVTTTATMEFFASQATTGPAFCPHCGTILDHPDTNNIVCSACEYRCQYQNLPSLSVVTSSEEKPVPKWLKADQSMSEVTGPARATVEETCPKCGNPQMDYYTMQLRSADEGQTVFYECKKCGHKFSVNN